MDSKISLETLASPYELLFKALSLIPVSHYLLFVLFTFLVFLYNFLEIHFLRDLFTGFRGDPVSLSYNSCSELYESVASKCQVLHGRYLVTPWLSSPHIQTAFLTLAGNSPVFSYRRNLFHAPDGGTIALDWLMSCDVREGALNLNNNSPKADRTPILIVIPGLTSDSSSAYIKHIAYKMARHGWNIVVSNHRGLGGISMTSDCFYNAGWTEDIRKVIDYLHDQYPEAPLFIVGTSIGANVLVKYLGEDGLASPVVGAAAVCSPWDLLICDRFINRRFVQKFYDRALTIGLQGYAQLHQSIMSRLADWEGIKQSRSVREFDNYATRLVGNYETVDTYYRRSSSSSFVGNVSVPLLCISALDDPVCTREAIPWDECRANKNIILATTRHGGHLAYYEGVTASSLWWVRAVEEFFDVLHSSPFMCRRKEMQITTPHAPPESSIDRGPYVNVTEDGMVSAIGNKETNNVVEEELREEDLLQTKKDEEMISDTEKSVRMTEETQHENGLTQPSEQNIIDDVIAPIRCADQLSKHSRKSIWLLAYIALITTWPLLGSALGLLFKKRFKTFLPAKFLRR